LSAGFSKPEEKWNSEVEDDLDGLKELGQSKWSKDFEDDTEKSKNTEENTHALSGLAQAYSTGRKRVSWGDRVCLCFIVNFIRWRSCTLFVLFFSK
jgi:YLP motif-containing protein 1